VLSLPTFGQEIGIIMRQDPTYRNITIRLLEPLTAPEDENLTAIHNNGHALDNKLPQKPQKF